ncbi:hypothetical protein [Streptomyces sp. NPDC087294]|uniref:hypothetical protein n=1 Tax=Streptomyces sp. NPDC087294 TaxID=3365777 RepID=UPI0038027996
MPEDLLGQEVRQERAPPPELKACHASPGTLYNHIPDLRDLRELCAVPRQLEAGS